MGVCPLGSEVQGSGFSVLGSKVQGSGFNDLGSKVRGSAFKKELHSFNPERGTVNL
jgi:hypothetical protein